MTKPRMDLSAFVGKLLEEQDGDVLREGIRVLSQALMETEVAGLIGADRHERTPERTGHRKWVPDADVGYAGGDDRAGDPEGPTGHVLSFAPPAPPAGGARAPRGGAGSLRAWGFDAESR